MTWVQDALMDTSLSFQRTYGQRQAVGCALPVLLTGIGRASAEGSDHHPGITASSEEESA
jgi:hypothetical protein